MSDPKSDHANAHLKQNALIDFMDERTKSGKPTIGGVIIAKEINNNILFNTVAIKLKIQKTRPVGIFSIWLT